MDFIFEDDMDEVGSDIEAYCPKCKADTAHTVITKYEDEVRRVQCSTCGDVHAYRKPRGEVEDETPEPAAAKKRAAAKKPTWQEAIDKIGVNKAHNNARPYTIRDHYHEGDIVSHPKFGVGFVTEITENKAEVTFQDERRVLVHNRPDLAAVMPAIAPQPAPREEKGRKKGKGAKAAPPPPPAPAAKGKGAAPPPSPAPAAKGKAAPAKPEPKGKQPEAKRSTTPVAATQGGKAARAQAAVKKKEVAKAKASAKPTAKPAAKPTAKPAAKPAAKAARGVRRPEPAKAKVKARR
jgi:hypothetical protein